MKTAFLTFSCNHIYIVLFLCIICNLSYGLPPDLLVDGNLQLNENDTFRRYFHSGATYKAIQHLLSLYHGVFLSISALKMKRKRMGLCRRRGAPNNNLQATREAIQALLPNLPWTAGYRNVFQTLKYEGFDVRRDRVMNLMRELDPGGVEIRRRRRLKRRRYVSPGPDFTWHVDGYDKLKPYGFAIHGAIDGFSRRIMWLEVNPSNNNPRFVATHYMLCVEQRRGCPHILSTDRGTENGVIAALQCTFRSNDDDIYSGIDSHRYVKSTSNQRIEAWWCLFRRDRMEWWIDFFTHLSTTPEFNKDDYIHKLCIRYCFMPVLKKELQDIALRWNNHYNTGNPLGKCPPGRPDLLYFLNDSFLHNLSENNIDEGLDECEIQTTSGCMHFDEYANEVFADLNWQAADDCESAYEQYIQLKEIAERID